MSPINLFMKPVTEQISYPYKKRPVDVLRDAYKARLEKNEAYSLTSFARDLGISKTLLSRIFSGQRPVSVKFTIQLSSALDLSESQSRCLLIAAIQASGKNTKISKKLREQFEIDVLEPSCNDEIVYTTVEVERFKAMASWHHLALMNLTELKDFNSDPLWISKKLGITTFAVNEAINRLFALGLLQEVNGVLKRSNQSIYVKTNKSETAVRNFHSQMIEKAQIELTDSSPKAFQQRLINGITFACDEDQIALIKEKIDKLQDEILALTSGGGREHLYQMNIQFFSLTKPTQET